MNATAPLAEALLDALPQTQCMRCGYADCGRYAEAIAAGAAEINRCPPGGAEGVARLARISGRAALPLNSECGREGPRGVALVDEAWCIGCTLCIKACPVDCIIGAPKQMHSIASDLCTGCELCIPACPVDCISMSAVSGERGGWHAWSDEQARQARERYALHRARIGREADHEPRHSDFAESSTPDAESLGAAVRKRAIVAAALARAKEARRP